LKHCQVVKHIKNLTGIEPVIEDNSHLYGAIGAAINLIDDNKDKIDFKFNSIDDIFLEDVKEKKYFYQPLKLELSEYPDFSSFEKFNFKSEIFENASFVEVDIYRELKKPEYSVFIGVDIGSTSTKAILIDENKNVLAGFYTRTSGQPVIAVRIIFETIQHFIHKKQLNINVLGAGTTGSGRKFVGKIIGADVIPDEITAHARAALELDSPTGMMRGGGAGAPSRVVAIP
jgi:activator of 2-hydroxyglutaryl-CoA dehydratase